MSIVVEFLLLASILLQLAAAAQALRLIRTTGWHTPWTLFTFAILLMAVRRFLTFSGLFSGAPFLEGHFGAELAALFSSFLFLLGALRIAPQFEEARETQEKLRQRNADLERQTRAAANTAEELEAFNYATTHELRGPLVSIKGFADLLRADMEAADNTEGQMYVERILAAEKRMDDLIERLLLFSRLKQVPLDVREVDLSALARRIAGEWSAKSPRRTVEFEIEEGLRARGDPGLLHDVLDNLLGNAHKYTEPADPARIAFGVDRDAAPPGEAPGRWFFVRDNGVGFDEGEAKMLFTPFKRLRSALSFPGTGIGLATVQRILARHGGMIEAEGRPGAGATFRFFLPAHPPADAGEPAA